MEKLIKIDYEGFTFNVFAKLQNILNFEIEKDLNTHGKLKLIAIISKTEFTDNAEKFGLRFNDLHKKFEKLYLDEKQVKQKELDIVIKDEKQKELIFGGILESLRILEENLNGFIIELKFIEKSYLKDFSFNGFKVYQNKDLTYKDILKDVLDISVSSNIKEIGEKINSTIIRYNESSYSFAKRILANCKQPLIFDYNNNDMKLKFIEKNNNKEIELEKKLIVSIDDKGNTTYILKDDKFYDIGQTFLIKNKKNNTQQKLFVTKLNISDNIYRGKKELIRTYVLESIDKEYKAQFIPKDILSTSFIAEICETKFIEKVKRINVKVKNFVGEYKPNGNDNNSKLFEYTLTGIQDGKLFLEHKFGKKIQFSFVDNNEIFVHSFN